MKNNIQDLNNYLFEQLERLNDDELLNDAEKLEIEIKRSKAVTNVSQTIINNAQLVLNAKKFCNDFGIEGKEKENIFMLGAK